ncbi:DUF2306 domain-containing protein [Olivibacter sp. XZL3]|uniref:DUF2306 domain-containing protein n=1 Tax=Olivibacter sp. XZL3 TaxID=1735116 RepID=UPI0010666ABA|nr:DUF2306 domain-containing protein [Olivibacter sp. XZL3]
MRKFLFIITAILAILLGAYPLMYAFVDHQYTFLNSKPPNVLKDLFWKSAFYFHVVFGGLSLFIGWMQFGPRFRKRHIKLHRSIGMFYALSVFISSLSGIYIALYANGGIIPVLGFILLGLIWFVSTIMAYVEIVRGHTMAHKRFMTYSYACTFAAVTLRLWLPLLVMLINDAELSYRIVAWLCWVPNLFLAYSINKYGRLT